ncbi:hypothetical protein JOF56_011644 [Kibdelosporangium banguiense]|uniref:Uncharacterized protein n=1 Tax=Kibdelosporangium banguiense TaxID=1365924 RepID=A0ABS4U3L7_9PSEU|nr:hypothetical protein [Kibdelosporangium banguiense]MBP2331259.1 hypothetical protein [Kibdelosporangium banguiense]
MTATIAGPACRLPIGGGQCRYPAGHNGECDPNPVTGAVTDDPVLNAIDLLASKGIDTAAKFDALKAAVEDTRPIVWCDWTMVPARTDEHADAHYCEHCGATDHETYVDGSR